MTTSTAGTSRFVPRIDTDRIAVFAMALVVVVPLLVFVVAPLFEIFKMSFVTADGIGFDNYVRYVNSPKFVKVVGNSLAVSAASISSSSLYDEPYPTV